MSESHPPTRLVQEAQVYQIRVQGRLDDRWSSWFNGLEIRSESEDPPITSLTGPIVDQACLRVGIEPETRAFFPHITIARIVRSTRPIDSFVAAFGGLSSPSFPIDNFCLYESDLTPQGPIYSIIERYPLERTA